MTSGSMLIPNYLKEQTLLKVSDGVATAEPDDNSLADAKAALVNEKRSRSPIQAQIAFLTLWIRLYDAQKEKLDKEKVTDSINFPKSKENNA